MDKSFTDLERAGWKLHSNGFDAACVHFGPAPYIVKMDKEDDPYPDGTEKEKWDLRLLFKHYLGPIGRGEEYDAVIKWEKEFRHLANMCKRYLDASERKT